jgi:Xaa-Pro dipeptidase
MNHPNLTIESSIEIITAEGDLLEALPFPDSEYEARIEKLRAKMRAGGIDVLVSFSPENINYLTGHDTPAYQYLQACVVAGSGMPVNVLRSIDASNTFYRSWNRTAVVYEDSDDPVVCLTRLVLAMIGDGHRVALETDPCFVGASRYNRLVRNFTLRGLDVVEQDHVEQLRLIKSAREIGKIRAATHVASQTMRAAVAMAGSGVNENDIAACVWSSLIGHGGEFPGLPPFIVSGKRTSLGHATWSGRTLQTGDTLAFEFPGVVARYAGPLFRSGIVGEKTGALKQLEAATLRSLELLMAAMRPGITCDALHAINVASFARSGYQLGHRSGYSVGLNYAPDWGEGNILSIRAGEMRVIEEGMVFHLVPGIYVPGEHVVVISETVVVTSDGCECLTDYPRALFQVD